MPKITKASTIAKRLLKFFGPNGKRWCRGAYAKDRNGREVETSSPKATRFCLSGAMAKLKLPQMPLRNEILDYSATLAFNMGVIDFNDSHYFAGVKKMLTKVAAGKA